MDIRDYEEDTMYKSIVTQEHRNINLILAYKTNLNKFFIYKRDFVPLTNDYNLTGLQSIDIVKQKTGFGYKKFFKCPYCGQQRQNLYFVEDELKFACRSCIKTNIYKSRTNLYDGDIENIISYKTIKIMRHLKADTHHISMYNLIGNIPNRPKYMNQEKYAIAVKRLYFLHYMWEQCVTIKYGSAVGIYSTLGELSVRDINDMLEKKNTEFVYEHFLFPEYHREAFEYLESYEECSYLED